MHLPTLPTPIDRCFGFVGGRCELEVMLFLKDPATKSIAVKRTGVLPFSLRADSPGLLILDALLSSSPSSLGFQSPPLESRLGDASIDSQFDCGPTNRSMSACGTVQEAAAEAFNVLTFMCLSFSQL